MARLKGRKGGAIVAVITIVDEEFAAVRAIDQFNAYASDSPCLFRQKIGQDQYDVILAQSADRSNTPCAELVADLAESFRPEFIVLSGIAGGIGERDGVGLGDVIVADHIEAYEIKKFVDGRDMTRRVALDHPSKYLRETIAHRVRHSGSWRQRIQIPRPCQGDPKVIIGNMIAEEKILGDGENVYQRTILAEFDKAIAVDMESYDLARGVYSARGTRYYNLNYLVVRGISDLVDSEANDSHEVDRVMSGRDVPEGAEALLRSPFFLDRALQGELRGSPLATIRALVETRGHLDATGFRLSMIGIHMPPDMHCLRRA